MSPLLIAAVARKASPGRGLELFGIKFVGVKPRNGQTLLVTVIAIEERDEP